MVGLVIQLLIFCIFVFLVYYIINNVLPEPMRRIATVIAVVLFLLILLVCHRVIIRSLIRAYFGKGVIVIGLGLGFGEDSLSQ